MWNGVSRRRFPRLNLPVQLSVVHEGIEKDIAAKTENVGIGGLCASLESELEKSTPISIKLLLPKQSKMIECQGKVVWVVHKRLRLNDGFKIIFDTGIEFVDLKADDKRVLEYSIRALS